MKALTVSIACFLLTACATSQVALPPGVPGTYDLVRLGTEPVPNYRINKLWIEFTGQGTWELFQEPRGTGNARGRYSVGEQVGGCYQAEIWLYVNPGGKSPMEFCEGAMRWYAYHELELVSLNLIEPMFFEKRR